MFYPVPVLIYIINWILIHQSLTYIIYVYVLTIKTGIPLEMILTGVIPLPKHINNYW